MVYQVKMKNGEMWRPKVQKKPFSLKVRSGKAWVTVIGSKTDFILSEGEFLPLDSAGVLVESLTPELIVEGEL